MSNIKRVSLTTIEIKNEKVKTRRKCVRISVPIVEEPSSKEYSRYNYETLYKSKSALDKKRQKKDTNGALNGLTNGCGVDEEEEEDEDEMVKIARKFEQKYGGTQKKDNYSELGAGYDEEDSFIDNTDAYNDELSEDLLPKHGGYYLNRGHLELERIDIPEEVIENEEEICRNKIKRTINVIQSSDEEEPSEAEESGKEEDEEDEDDGEDDGEEEEDDGEEEDQENDVDEKRKPEENGVDTPQPKPSNSGSILSTIESVIGNQSHPSSKHHSHRNEVGVIKKKKKRKREREEQEEEEQRSKQRKQENNAVKSNEEMNTSPQHHKHVKRHTDKGQHHDRMEHQENLRKSSGATVKELLKPTTPPPTVPNNMASLPTSEDVDMSDRELYAPLPSTDQTLVNGHFKDESNLPPESNLPCGSGSNLSPTDLKIPETLPDEIRELITGLKQVANQVPNLSTRKMFPPEVNTLLIELEAKCRGISSANKNAVYAHIGSFLPVSKDTLIKRSRKMSVDKEEEKLEGILNTLKLKIDSVMPGVMLQYSKDCEMAAKKLGADKAMENASGDPKPLEKIHMPRKIFPWDLELRSKVHEVIDIKEKCFRILKCRKETEEEYVKEYLEMKVKALWPDGWMRTAVLYREGKSTSSMRSRKYTPKPASKKVVVTPTSQTPQPRLLDVQQTTIAGKQAKATETIFLSSQAQALLTSLAAVNSSYQKPEPSIPVSSPSLFNKIQTSLAASNPTSNAIVQSVNTSNSTSTKIQSLTTSNSTTKVSPSTSNSISQAKVQSFSSGSNTGPVLAATSNSNAYSTSQSNYANIGVSKVSKKRTKVVLTPAENKRQLDEACIKIAKILKEKEEERKALDLKIVENLEKEKEKNDLDLNKVDDFVLKKVLERKIIENFRTGKEKKHFDLDKIEALVQKDLLDLKILENLRQGTIREHLKKENEKMASSSIPTSGNSSVSTANNAKKLPILPERTAPEPFKINRCIAIEDNSLTPDGISLDPTTLKYLELLKKEYERLNASSSIPASGNYSVSIANNTKKLPILPERTAPEPFKINRCIAIETNSVTPDEISLDPTALKFAELEKKASSIPGSGNSSVSTANNSKNVSLSTSTSSVSKLPSSISSVEKYSPPKSTPSPIPHSISNLINTTQAHVSSNKYNYPPEGLLLGSPSSFSVKPSDLLPVSTSLSSLISTSSYLSSLTYGLPTTASSKLPSPAAQTSANSKLFPNSGSNSTPASLSSHSTNLSYSSSLYKVPPYSQPPNLPFSLPQSTSPSLARKSPAPPLPSPSPPKKHTSPTLSLSGAESGSSSILDLSPGSVSFSSKDRSVSPQSAKPPSGPLHRDQSTSPVSSKVGTTGSSSMLSLKQRILQDSGSKTPMPMPLHTSYMNDTTKSSLYSSTPRDSSSSHLINESLSTTPTSSLIGGKSNPSPVIGGIATPHSSVVGRLDTTPVSHKTSRSDHSISSLSGVATKSDQATSLSISAGGTRSDHSVKSIVSAASGGFQTSAIITPTTCALNSTPRSQEMNRSCEPRQRKSSRSSSKECDGKESEIVADVLKSLMSLNQMSESSGSPDKTKGLHETNNKSSNQTSAVPKIHMGFEDEFKRHLKRSGPTPTTTAPEFPKDMKTKTFQSEQLMMRTPTASEFSMRLPTAVKSTPTPHVTQGNCLMEGMTQQSVITPPSHTANRPTTTCTTFKPRCHYSDS